MALLGKCVYKGKCDLNCQVFVLKEGELLSMASCMACGHLAAFHEQNLPGSKPGDSNQVSCSNSLSHFAASHVHDQNSSSSQSGAAFSPSSSGKFGRVMTFERFKEAKTSSVFRGKSKSKVKSGDEDVTINIGLMKFDRKCMMLKPRWGKRLPLKIRRDATHGEILQCGLSKWKVFNKTLIEEEENYLLLYEDGNEALFLPGQTQNFFVLSKYKEELGRDYRRIVLFLCAEKDYECNYSYQVFGKEPRYSSDEFEEEEGSTKIREHEETHDESEGGLTSQDPPSAGIPRQKRAKAHEEEDNEPSQSHHLSELPGVSNYIYQAGPSVQRSGIPEDFLWEAEFDMEVDEKELIKAATARSLEVQSHSKEEIDLETIIQKYKEEQSKPETCTFIVLRKKIMQTCTMAIQKETFDFSKLPCIVFSGEDAADLGGPRREFFRLVMRGVCQELGVFEGSSNNLVFSHDHSVISSRKPYLAGQLLSWSILHAGPGLHSLSEDVYYLMMDMHDDVDPVRAALAIADDGAASVARGLIDVHDDLDHSLEEFKRQHMEWLINQGISLGFNRNKISKKALLMQIIKQALLYRVKESIGLFIAGLDSVGGLLSGYIRANPKAFVPVFCDKSAPLTIQTMKSLYVIKWSEEGSNQRVAEESTIFCWEQFLLQVYEGFCKECSLADLLSFVTGADRIPALGFIRMISICFYEFDGGRRPWSSTCSLQLNLPRGIEEQDVFNALMLSSVNESCGFGKI